MSDKSFEQQVREELSDLRMKPNAAVWESVAASLKKERKRRWVLWMFFLLAGLSATALWWLTQEQTGVQELSNKNQVQENSGSFAQTKTLPQKDSTTGSSGIQTEKTGVINREEPLIKKGPSNTTILSATKVKPIQAYQPSIANTVVQPNEKVNSTSNVIDKAVLKDEKEAQSLTTTAQANIGQDTVKTITVQNEKEVKTDTSSFTKTQGINKDTIAVITETEPVKPILPDSSLSKKQSAKASKWQWRIGFNAGTSGVRNSIRSLLENTNSRAYDNAFSGNSAPITGGGSGTVNSMKPVVRDAFSFGSFIEVLKKMGKKEQHALGLTAGYHLYSTRTGVGSLNTGTVQFSNVNTTNDANKYYGVKDSASYTSYYHFIHLGLSYYQSLKWFKKIDMQWYAGVGVNALLGSNGLHLGSMNTNSYLFQNRSLLRTIQMDIAGGLDFGLGKSRQIYLGPQVQYMLSNLSKQPGVNQHLFRPSVRLSFLLDKGK
jgi:hypothetical protein